MAKIERFQKVCSCQVEQYRCLLLEIIKKLWCAFGHENKQNSINEYVVINESEDLARIDFFQPHPHERVRRILCASFSWHAVVDSLIRVHVWQVFDFNDGQFHHTWCARHNFWAAMGQITENMSALISITHFARFIFVYRIRQNRFMLTVSNSKLVQICRWSLCQRNCRVRLMNSIDRPPLTSQCTQAFFYQPRGTHHGVVSQGQSTTEVFMFHPRGDKQREIVFPLFLRVIISGIFWENVSRYFYE